jgi:peptidoglycan hydrolase-like protein with peptidoglycan-binding domain
MSNNASAAFGIVGKANEYKGIVVSQKKISLVLVDADGKPRPNLSYILKADGETFEEKTDSDGKIEHSLQPTTKQATLIVDGRQITLNIEALDNSKELKGAQQRLNNLGYDCGPANGVMSARTKQAIQKFQSEHGLKVTGLFNEETSDKLCGTLQQEGNKYER